MIFELPSPHTVALSRQRKALAKSRRAPISLEQCLADKRPSTDAVASQLLLRATVLFQPVLLA